MFGYVFCRRLQSVGRKIILVVPKGNKWRHKSHIFMLSDFATLAVGSGSHGKTCERTQVPLSPRSSHSWLLKLLLPVKLERDLPAVGQASATFITSAVTQPESRTATTWHFWYSPLFRAFWADQLKTRSICTVVVPIELLQTQSWSCRLFQKGANVR